MRLASLRLRFLAALVDAAVLLSAIAALVGSAIAGVVVYTRVRGHDRGQEGQQEGDEDRPDGHGEDEPFETHRARREVGQTSWRHAALAGAAAGLAVAERDWRGPGFRVEFYKASEINPFAGCGWQLAGPVVSQVVLALGSRDGRTVRDRLTGTRVIIDR